MKKVYLLLLLAVMSGLTISAQDEVAPSDTSYWDWGNTFGVQFGQTTLKNWSQGGNSQISVNMSGRSFANFAKGKHLYENQFIGDWGIVRFRGQTPQISANNLEINTQYGYQLKNSWYFSFLANLKSQFTWGFDYPDGAPKVFNSKFGAPAYLKIAPGFTYKPNDIFQFFFAPAAGKMTFVREDGRIDETRFGVDAGQTVRAEFGAYARAQLNKEIFKNVNLFSVLELFNNYTDPNKPNRKNIDVDWQTGIDLKVNSWLAASISAHVIYDNDIEVPVDRDGDGVLEGTGPRTQFRETLTVGLTYSFNKKK